MTMATVSMGYVGALYLSLPGWTAQTITDELMQEVDLSAEGRPRYTVYEIADATKRYIDDDETAPVFQGDTAGNSSFSTITPYKVEYPGSRIYLTTARNSADVVRCHSGSYIPVSMVQGVLDYNFAGRWKTADKRFLRDSATRTIMIENAWEATANLASMNTCASYTTGLTGNNNDITITHDIGGTLGNDYSIEYVDPGGVTSTLGITVSSNAITVNLARAASAIITTANDIVTLWATNAILQERKVSAKVAVGNTGVGVVTALTHTHLSGGLDPYDFPGIEGKCVAVFYDNLDADGRWEDYGTIPAGTLKIDPNDITNKTLTIKQYGGPRSGPFYRKS